MSDDKLVRLSQEGNGDASVAVLRRYMCLIKSRASYFYNGTIEMEDLVQEGIIALYLCIKQFDFKSSAFSTFARLCVDRAIMSEMRLHARKKRIPQDKLISLDEVNGLFSDDNPENILIESENVTTLENSIKRLLSKREYKVFVLFLHNYGVKEISRLLETSEKSVNNTLYRIRNKLSNL